MRKNETTGKREGVDTEGRITIERRGKGEEKGEGGDVRRGCVAERGEGSSWIMREGIGGGEEERGVGGRGRRAIHNAK